MFLFRQNILKYSDEELLSFFLKTQDPFYFGELYNRYIPLIYGVCLKYFQNEERAKDAVMDLFEELLPKISRYTIRNFSTWLYCVTKNHCLQFLRKDEPEMSSAFDLSFMESDDILHLLNEEEEERLELLNRCLQKLPEPQRISIESFFLKEMSYADIVDSTGFHLKSVKSYLQNGKRNLKNCIENNQTE